MALNRSFVTYGTIGNMVALVSLVLMATAASPARAVSSSEPAAVTVPSADAMSLIVGAGAAVERESGASAFGVAAFLEYEAWPGVLELELGGQRVRRPGAWESAGDLLFKWPLRLARRLDLMIGAGPSLVRVEGSTALGIEGAVDLMWWPTTSLGFSVEPSYERIVVGGSTGAVGMTAGPIIGW